MSGSTTPFPGKTPSGVILALLFAAVSSVVGREAAADDKPVKHVVLISVDGLGASYLSDPRAELPTLRKLAAGGAVAEGMLTSFPSVTWPSHTSLITGVHPGKHGVLANVVFDRQQDKNVTYIGDPTYTKDQAVRVPTLYDAAAKAGLSCGSVIWPCCNGAKSLQWTVPDTNKPELHAQFTTASLFEELAEKKIDLKQLALWGWDKKRSTERDQMYVQVACHLLQKHRPNLLLVHLITVDGVEHDKGPHSPEALAAAAQADRHVREICDVIDRPPFAGSTAVFVVSDHGFAPYQKNIRVNALLRSQGLIELAPPDPALAGKDKPVDKFTRRRAWCVPEGGSAFVYCLDADPKTRQALHDELTKSLAAVEGVAKVLSLADCEKLGLVSPDKNQQAPDFALAATPGYAFTDGLSGDVVTAVEGLKGTHGHPPTTEGLAATFIASGTGIKSGTKLKTISNLDVAPTIARLLGVSLPSADGRVLSEVLSQP